MLTSRKPWSTFGGEIKNADGVSIGSFLDPRDAELVVEEVNNRVSQEFRDGVDEAACGLEEDLKILRKLCPKQ